GTPAIADRRDPNHFGDAKRSGLARTEKSTPRLTLLAVKVFAMHHKKVLQPLPVHSAPVVGNGDSFLAAIQRDANFRFRPRSDVLQTIHHVFPNNQSVVLEQTCTLQKIARYVALDEYLIAHWSVPPYLSFQRPDRFAEVGVIPENVFRTK